MPETQTSFTNHGFLNKRNSNTENELHRTIDSLANEINGPVKVGKRPGIQDVAENIKGKRFKEFSDREIEELGQINASQDRFRPKFLHQEYDQFSGNYQNNADFRWVE